MKLIDRYVLRSFLSALAFGLVSFIAIFIIVDLIEHLGKFISNNAPAHLIVRYYLYYIPYIVVLTIPVAMLLATMFSLGLLARNNELTAIKVGGVSLYRILAPVLAVSFLIAFSMLIMGEFIVPPANAAKTDIYRVNIERKPRLKEVIRTNMSVVGRGDLIYYIRNFDTNTNTGRGLFAIRKVGNRIAESWTADRIEWDDSMSAWKLSGAKVRKFEARIEGDSSRQVGYKEAGTYYAYEFAETPEELARIQKSPDEMGFFQLKEYIDLKERSGERASKELVNLYLKITFPFVNFIVVLIGAPLVVNPKRSGVAVGFAASLTISFIYFALVRVGQSLGQNGTLSPLVAASMANVVFGLLGVVLIVRAQK